MAGKRGVRRATDPATAIVPGLVLAETLDLREAAPLAAALLGCRGTDLAVDAGAVRRLGGQCLQVLLSANASWQGDGKALRFIKSSAEFTDALAQFGATALLSPAA